MKKAERSLHWDTKNTSCNKPQAKVQGAERNFCKSSIALTRKAITAYAMPVCHRSVVDNKAERAGSLKEKKKNKLPFTQSVQTKAQKDEWHQEKTGEITEKGEKQRKEGERGHLLTLQ